MSEKSYYSVYLQETERWLQEVTSGFVGRQVRTDSFTMSSDGADISSIPYLNDVRESTKGIDVNYERLLVVGPNLLFNIKAAKYLMDKKLSHEIDEKLYAQEIALQKQMAEISSDDEFDDNMFDEEYDMDLLFDDDYKPSVEYDEPITYHIELKSKPGSLPLMGNPFLMPISLFNNPEGQVGLIISGLDDNGDIKDKLDAILASKISQLAICLTPEDYDRTWVKMMIVKYGYTPVFIKDIPSEYFENVFTGLLKDNHLKLEGNKPGEVIRYLRNKIGDDFSEEYLESIIVSFRKKLAYGKTEEQLQKIFPGGNATIRIRDMFPGLEEEESAVEELRKMPGLEEPKRVFEDFLAVKKMSMTYKKLARLHSNMIFTGNPGTGKTTFANLMARASQEIGVVGAGCVIASRSDIVGMYVGHTAPKVEALFKKANSGGNGGILFVDEAGFFLNQGAGGFVDEALKEFVRFMEIYPDVTVIFGMYEREAAELLKLDEGLASRFSLIVHFNDYSDDELLDIFDLMIEKIGFKVDKNSHEIVAAYIGKLRNDSNWGNAREIRKIAESAITVHCKRIADKPVLRKTDLITVDDVKTGILKIGHKPAGKRVMGFQSGDTVNAAVQI